jgi:hypothetical protein
LESNEAQWLQARISSRPVTRFSSSRGRPIVECRQENHAMERHEEEKRNIRWKEKRKEASIIKPIQSPHPVWETTSKKERKEKAIGGASPRGFLSGRRSFSFFTSTASGIIMIEEEAKPASIDSTLPRVRFVHRGDLARNSRPFHFAT